MWLLLGMVQGKGSRVLEISSNSPRAFMYCVNCNFRVGCRMCTSV